MSFKQTKLYSILKNKCPRCHEGDFFVHPNPYKLKKFDKMYSYCARCGQTYEMETGFYYGAMYVSYALTVAFGIALFVAMCVVFYFSALQYLIALVICMVLLLPLFYRISRLIWINFFVKYNPARRNPPLEAIKKPPVSRY